MEIVTYIENHTPITLPTFKHPTKTILPVPQQLQQSLILNPQLQQNNFQSIYSQNISIPDKIIMDPTTSLQNQMQQNIKCYLLFGYQLKLKDWQLMRNMYNINVRIKLYRGNQIVQISQGVYNAKSHIKGQKNINQPHRTLIKRDQKLLQSYPYMYTVQIAHNNSQFYQKILYYLPSTFDKKSKDYPLQCIKYRYFNHKMLQILNQYVSLQNSTTSCCKDMAHHQFQAILYSGKVISFLIFLKLDIDVCSQQVSQSFIQKLSQISMTDKHLLDQVDPFDFGQIKKQIRNYYLQQKRLRTSLTFQKIRIVQQIQNALQFFNLKQLYPKKLTYTSITSQMLKKIRNQNLQNKSIWIKQQNFIIQNLQTRIIDLQNTKQKYKQILIQQQKNNYLDIQEIRNQIKMLEKFIKYQQVQKNSRIFDQSIRKNVNINIINNNNMNMNININLNNNTTNSIRNTNTNNSTHTHTQTNTNTNNTNTTNTNTKLQKLSKTNEQLQQRSSILHNNKKNTQTSKYKYQLEQLEKQKILKFQMIKAEFQMQRQFVRRKAQYSKATQDLLNYLIDC